VDTLETAQAFGLRLSPAAGSDPALAAVADFDPYQEKSFESLIATWLPLTYAVNSLNRSMGQPDLYPFVIAPPVVAKLRFIHELTTAAWSLASGPSSNEKIPLDAAARSRLAASKTGSSR
jgi:hypothetical protein